MANRKEIKGIITEYNFERGFGFITEIKKDVSYFFHISNTDKNMQIIPNKTEVIFDICKTEKGLQATNIKPYSPKIEGKFSEIKLPNKTILLNNKEKMDFLEENKTQLLTILENLTKIGVSYTNTENNIKIDVESLEKLKNPRYCKKNRSQFVPSGYPQTATYILYLFQKQIDEFEKEYAITKSGKRGEDNSYNSLKSVNLNFPVLHNVYLEEQIETNNGLDTCPENYSSEIDSIIITDRAIFIIETKNYKKGTSILVTKDGEWYKDNNKLDINPIAQVTNHSLLIRRFLLKNNINFELPIIPIIAIGNGDIKSSVEKNENLLVKVLHTDLLGGYILNYIESNPQIITIDNVQKINSLIQSNALPLKKYSVIQYNYNFKTIENALLLLIKYWEEDKCENDKIVAEEKRIAEEKYNSPEAVAMRKIQEEIRLKTEKKEGRKTRFKNGVKTAGTIAWAIMCFFSKDD